MKTNVKKPARSLANRNGRAGEPAWEIARFFPSQGDWTEDEYFALDTGNQPVELSDGFLEVLPMPTMTHQWILSYLWKLLEAFAYPKLGLVMLTGLRVRLWSEKVRDPDVAFMLKANRHRAHEKFWDGADLVMEVVSPDPESRRRDLVTKRREYARAGISEYWIVDPKLKQITVLRLRGKKYEVFGEYKKGQTACSHLLPGFTVDVDAAFTGP
jgi:Uma2 family endonuclease